MLKRRNMNTLNFVIFFGLLHVSLASSVIEWMRDWGSGLLTREFAQMDEDQKTVIHFSTNDAAAKSAPAITFYDYAYRSDDFRMGILAIRPLQTGGQQLCFITGTNKWFWESRNMLNARHQTTIEPVLPYDKFELRTAFPSALDPLSVMSLKDFCNVDRSHMFYMEPVNLVSGSKIRIHGLFRGYNIGVPDKLTNIVFGN